MLLMVSIVVNNIMLLTTLMNNIIPINNTHYATDDRYEYVCILVGGIPTPLKNIKSIGMIIPSIWENKIHVPNQQPKQYYVGIK